MSSGPIPFIPNQANLDERLSGASPVAHNLVLDGKGTVRRRPGIVAHPDYYSTAIEAYPITGMKYTTTGKLFVGVQNGSATNVYKVGGGALFLGSLAGSGRPLFTETESIVTVATGGAPEKIILAGDTMSPLGGGPPFCSHTVATAARLAVNRTMDFKSQVYYSDFAAGSSYAGFETWYTGAAGYFDSSARPDTLVAIHEMLGDIYCFGSTSLQVFTPDPAYDFAPSGQREAGCVAPYSIVALENRFAWLDDKVRFVMSDGRNFQVIQGSLSTEAITHPEDCFGYRYTEGPYDLIVWTFPTDGLTFAYDLVNNMWGQWTGVDSATNNWKLFTVRSNVIRHGYGDNVCGLVDGRVAMLSQTAYTDLGAPIRAYVETGHLNRGTDARKHCKAVRLALKRGQTSSSTAPVIQVSWRDDLGPWSNPVHVSLGASGDTVPVVELRSLGIYRRREWRFTFEGSDELALASATEEYDVLGV